MSEENNPKSEEKEEDITELKKEMQQESTEIPPSEPIGEVKPVKKKRKWVWIGVCGIFLPLLTILASGVMVGLMLIGVFTELIANCGSAICQSCCSSCENSCNNCCDNALGSCCENACNSTCSTCECSGCNCNSCDTSGCNCSSCDCSGCTCNPSNIMLSEKSSNIINLLKWMYYFIIGLFR